MNTAVSRKRAFDALVGTEVSDAVREFETDVPRDVADRFAEFRGMAKQTYVCIFCTQAFTKRDVGMLSCTFHPNEFFNHGARFENYSAAHPSHTNCRTCAALTLHSGQLNNKPTAIPIPWPGCTRIDHAASYDIFERPYSAFPAAYLSELHIFLDVKREARAGDGAAIRVLKRRSNVIVVDRPKQLTKRLFVDRPGTAVPFVVSVFDVYEAMARTFGLPSLDDAVRDAIAADPEAKAKKHGGIYAHDEAGVNDRIRAPQGKMVLFVPFVIIARVDQETPNSVGMHLKR